jgi:hypothetical protein
MHRPILALACLAILATAAHSAEPPDNIKRLSAETAIPAPVSGPGQYAPAPQMTVTPEMWFYEQEQRRYDDPRTAIRAQAALKTAQRQARLAAMQWYGLSNSRPSVTVDPLHCVYSPRWTSSGYNPSDWLGPSTTTILYVPSSSRD